MCHREANEKKGADGQSKSVRHQMDVKEGSEKSYAELRLASRFELRFVYSPVGKD